MKKTVFVILVFLLFSSVDGFSQKKKIRFQAKTDVADSLEYELIIIDSGFENWLVTKPSREFYSKEYYELRNRLYVSEWNNRHSTLGGCGLYETYIDYSYSIDYGLDLNYKLYYYFRYFEETNKIKLLPYGR